MGSAKKVWFYLLGYRGYRPVEVENAYLRMKLGTSTKGDKLLLRSFYGGQDG